MVASKRRALLAALDQVAGIDLAVGDAAGERRAHLGPFQVELGVAHRRLGRLELGAGDVEVGLALVVLGSGMVRWTDQRLAALDLQLGELDLRLLRATSAAALSTAISNGRLSMVNSRSPTLTIWPSLKWILSMKPETRARTSTEASASKRPENSSHWVTRLATGGEMVTGMAGGPPWAKAADEVKESEAGGSQQATM